MPFKKQQRLKGKEVRFLTKKRQIFSHQLLLFFFVEQYPNLPFHQISFHIPLAVSKKAVIRHQIKRILLQTTKENLKIRDFKGKRYKCFITLRKNKLEKLHQLIENKNTSELENYLRKECNASFISFTHMLGSKAPQRKK